MLGNLYKVKCVVKIEDSEKNMYTNVFFFAQSFNISSEAKQYFPYNFQCFSSNTSSIWQRLFYSFVCRWKVQCERKAFQNGFIIPNDVFLLSIRARERNLCSLSNLHFLSKSYRFHNNKHASSEYIHTQPHIHTQSWHIHEN